jgi:predicted Rossmann-fold nucleotide-binding protein
MDEIRTANFYERFGWLVDRADGYIAMEGGIGTLAEVTFTWQEILLGMVRKRPMVLVGRRWHRLFKTFKANLIATPDIYDAVQIVDSPSKAIELIREHFKLSDSRTAVIHH